ncbi:sugar phosphate isomerase/epimerase family protein [Lacipirellula limnantheis]|uniref:D-tagatose 3-epimerase n=1 Tax=Lacipirellula limnantheis TaxID=2528024 RepID=A0A517U5M4_9BACT|nr:sugar phosphate isomerase/epimerase family protein [Lacipirellula limnantheis]QDT75932.1 D-tagatose 3-epimerase [Lacipirellula limnantheis]
MKYAFCNEMFGVEPFDQVAATMRSLGYTGVEIAPFTLLPPTDAFDARRVSAAKRREIRQQAEAAGLEVIGLHWLLAKTKGFHLTSPDGAVRRTTADYLKALVELCGEIGGTLMVLGSPQQRNLLPGVGYNDAESYAAEILREAMPLCAAHGVTIALEPLGPTEGNFMLTAKNAIHLAELVESPHCRLHLDVKAMSSEAEPIDVIIRDSRDWLVHVHVNDPNLLGPGMGDVQYGPILTALDEIGYAGWLSLEVFKYEPSPVEIGQRSIEYLRKIAAAIASEN